MQQYLDALKHVLDNGRYKGDRTGTGTRSVFGYQMRFNLEYGFPLLTTKKVFTKGILHELLWFLKGDTNIKYLTDNGVHIWDGWADDNGDLGPVYGEMWRRWPTVVPKGPTGGIGGGHIEVGLIDQIQEAINILRTDPNSRRVIVSGWNPALLPDPSISPSENATKGKQALPPCHTMFQFYAETLTLSERVTQKVRMDYKIHRSHKTLVLPKYTSEDLDHAGVPTHRLSCQLYQRSADIFLGVPFNIASYALFTHMMADVLGMVAGDFIHTFGDLHIYTNHMDQVDEQLSRHTRALPELVIKPKKSGVHGIPMKRNIDDFEYDDFVFLNYHPHPAIKAEVSI